MTPNLESVQPPFTVAGTSVAPGTRERIEIPLPGAFSREALDMPVVVVHGRKPGPRLLVCAALHGDEVLGTEIVRRLLSLRALRRLRGSLIAVPVVNVYGFLYQSRYLPDRRDLNRSFPGREEGSIAARLAHIFLEQVVDRCTHAVDLHTGATGRENLPQIRACLDQAESAELARAFGAPVIMDSTIIDGSLRAAMHQRNRPYVVYEGGEALRLDERAVRSGLRGVLSVMHHLEMLPPPKSPPRPFRPVVADASGWVRSPISGLLRHRLRLGASVTKDDVLAEVHEPTGAGSDVVRADRDGIVIGRHVLPLVNEGDALFHIAEFSDAERAARRVQRYTSEIREEIAAEQAGTLAEPDRMTGA